MLESQVRILEHLLFLVYENYKENIYLHLHFNLLLLLAIICAVWIIEQFMHRIIEVFMPYVANAITKLQEKYEEL